MKTDFRDRSHLSAVDGDRPADKLRAGRRTALEQDEQVTCYVCLKELGIETSATVEITLAPRRSPTGKKVGGTKVHACAHCLARGRVTQLIG